MPFPTPTPALLVAADVRRRISLTTHRSASLHRRLRWPRSCDCATGSPQCLFSPNGAMTYQPRAERSEALGWITKGNPALKGRAIDGAARGHPRPIPVAQVSKPAVSPISKSAAAAEFWTLAASRGVAVSRAASGFGNPRYSRLGSLRYAGGSRAATPLGLVAFALLSQGSSVRAGLADLATLGFEPESRWDSAWEFPTDLITPEPDSFYP